MKYIAAFLILIPGAVKADPLNLYCQGFFIQDGSSIAFHVTLNRTYGATSYAWGKEFHTGCDDVSCLLNYPKETPDRPTEQISIDRITGAYQHNTAHPMRMLSMSEPGGCVLMERKF